MNEKEIIEGMFPKVLDTMNKLSIGTFKDFDELMSYIADTFTDTEKTFLAMNNILKFIQYYNNEQIKKKEIANIYI